MRNKNVPSNFTFGYRSSGSCGFDKTERIVELIEDEIKPDAIIVKECATYFPVKDHDLNIMINGWLEHITNVLKHLTPNETWGGKLNVILGSRIIKWLYQERRKQRSWKY